MDKEFLVKAIAQKCNYNNNAIIDIALDLIDLAFADMDSEGKLKQKQSNFKKIKTLLFMKI